MSKSIIIIGGGAAGFFAAITCAEAHPDYQVTILERSPNLLAKVKISGGGRCNVTHACFEPRQLVKYYPRGEKQLLGPFTRFNPSNTVSWFRSRGVELKKESDGRMFPVTDSSQTIINCFLDEARKLGIKIQTQVGVEELMPLGAQQAKWTAKTTDGRTLHADAVIVAAGSSARVWSMIEKLGIKIVPAVPSLFTFNINDERIKGLEGLSVELATVTVVDTKLKSEGPLLITHWGMSGPAILRLSAWGARILADKEHRFEISVNWCGTQTYQEVLEDIKQVKRRHAKKLVTGNPLFNIPRRLWERLSGPITGNKPLFNYADLSNKQIEQLAHQIAIGRFVVTGKSTFKDEFVTAGGVDLDEIDFKTMQSKKLQGLYFAGETLDIDAITGGFNFQSAWTTGWIAGTSV
jgi:predicted Rossmann fold flavoprotein